MLGLGLSMSLGSWRGGGGAPPIAVPINITSPEITGPTTNGATLTANVGTWTGTPTSYSVQWYRDGVAIGSPIVIASGDPAPTRTYSTATDEGRALTIEVIATNGDGSSLPAVSPARIGLYNPVIYSTNFQAASGPLVSEPGWSNNGGFNADKLLVGSLLTISGSLGTGSAAQRSGTSNLAEIRVKPARNAGDDVNNAGRYYYLAQIDPQNYINFLVTGNGCAFSERVANAYKDIGSEYGMVNDEGTEWRLPQNFVSGVRYIRVLRKAAGATEFVETPGSAAANAGKGYGPFNAALNSATQVGIGGSVSWSAALPRHTLEYAISVPQANSITVTAAAGVLHPTELTKQKVVLTGSYSGAVSALQYMILSETGHIIVPWTNMSAVTGGTYNYEAVFEYGEGGNGTAWVRDPALPSSAARSPVSLLVIAPKLPLTLGLNMAIMQTGRLTSNFMHNFKLGSFNPSYGEMSDEFVSNIGNPLQDYSTGYGVRADGFPTKIPTGAAYIDLGADYDWPLDSTSDVFGTYVLEFHPEVYWENSIGLGTSYTIENKNQAGGTADITLNGAYLAGKAGLLAFKITALPTDPNVGYMRMYKKYATPTDRQQVLRPQAASYHAAFDAIRYMDIKQVNRPGAYNGIQPLPITADMLSFAEPMSYRVRKPGPEFMIRMMRQNGVRPWDPLLDLMTGDALRAYAQYLKDNLAPGEEYGIEPPNEIWNNKFQQAQSNFKSCPVYDAGRVYQVQEGDWLQGATSGRRYQVESQKITSGSIAGGNAAGYVLLRGDYSNVPSPIAWNMVWAADEQLNHVDAAGTTLHANVMTNRTPTTSFNVNYARRFAWTIEQFETVFGPHDPETSNIKFIGCWQAASDPAVLEAILNEQNLYQKLSYFGIGPYGTNFGDYNGVPDQATMSRANRDKAFSDPAAFKAALITSMTQTALEGANTFLSFANWLAGYAKGKGLAPGRLKHAGYEMAPQHWIERNTPALKFTNGNITNASYLNAGNIADNGYYLKGATSGAFIPLGYGGGRPSTVSSGAFASGTAAGWVTRARGDFTYTPFQNGESCHLTDGAGTVLVSNAMVVSDASDIQSAIRYQVQNFFRSAEFGTIFNTYMVRVSTYGGWLSPFTGHGEVPTGRYAFGEFGYWNISSHVEDLTQHPIADILAFREAY